MGKAGAAAGAAAGAGLMLAVKRTAALEQSVGGSEIVFGRYHKNIQELARRSYASMGTSQNQYLETANKMGSLFQGTGMSVKKSTDLTSKSMQRAADVATAMGIDTAWAMESIAGAAKGNFTMMDNLGVAMNDTTLNAYALEKGIGKTTQQMTAQEKVGLAMELFMERTAKYAGNYAKENATLSGSLQTLKGAWDNFMSGVAGSDKQLSNALGGVVAVYGEKVPKIALALGSSVVGLGRDIIKNIPWLNELTKQVGNYLGPKLNALWQTIDKQVIPAGKRFWKEVVLPLAPAIGTLLVGSLGLAIDSFRLFLQVVTPVFNFLMNNKWIIWSVIGAIGAFKTALAINKAATAFNAGIALMTGPRGIAGMRTKLSLLRAAVATPMVMPALVIGAALGAISAVVSAWNRAKAAIEQQQAAVRAETDSSINMMKTARARYDRGEISYNQMRKIVGTAAKATGTNSAEGGPTLLGEHGAEIVNLPRGAQVTQAYRSRQQMDTSSSGPTVVIQNYNSYNERDDQRFFRDLGFALEAA